MQKIAVNKLVDGLLASLPSRQREIVEGRYGLKSGTELTLAEIGRRYSVTRERVRQIENIALQAVRKHFPQGDRRRFMAAIVNHLEKLGGVRREDLLVTDLKKMMSDAGPAKTFDNRVRFLLEMSGQVQRKNADAQYHTFWYLNGSAYQRAEVTINRLIRLLMDGGAWQDELGESLAKNYTTVSKRFAVNGYGDFGLASWSYVNPRTSRDWAFLVLKKTQKPLHFTQLAKVINGLRKDKPTNIQTVHNELIKDDRFVLVGRGIYGLKEFNIMPGTCREVLMHILKQHGPQKAKDAVKLVNSQRYFKKNTLLLNLQNKKHFLRLADGRYAVREV